MLVADEWILGAIVGISGFFGWMIKYMTVEIKTTMTENTKVLSQLLIIMTECPKKKKGDK